MKMPAVVLGWMIFMMSCNDQKVSSDPYKKEFAPEEAGFFPVTDFLYGQITEITTKGVNPLKIVRQRGIEDSSWIKMEDLKKEFALFLNPIIDSASLQGMFVEKKFLDQSLDAFTFTYDPVAPIPDSFLLQRWDVYIDPQKRTVKRIYMLKKTPDNKSLQLTWQADKWCRIVTLSADQKVSPALEKEVTIKWDF